MKTIALVEALSRPGDKTAIAAALEEARQRTWHLMSAWPESLWREPAADYLSPPAWDMGHIPNFEELWLVQRLRAQAELHAGFNDTYDAFAHPRQERPQLHLLTRDEVEAYMEEVRHSALATLADIALDGSPLTREGFVYWMIVLHEHQHQETLLQSLQMQGAAGHDVLPGPVRRLPEPVGGAPGFVHVPAGPFTMGAPRGPGVYDNEAPAHEVDVPAFDIARYPVTCGEFLAFVEDGGYDDARWWSPRGLQWLADEPHHAPLYWQYADARWWRRGPGCRVAVDDWPDMILSHVTHFEAEAYAAWAGARLPTEAEWEKAARWSPEGTRRMPWGDAAAEPSRANVDQLAFAPSRIGAFPQGAAACGAEHMIGDVWEWTQSGLDPYPGFEAFPYDEYTKVFLGGDYRVLRGGSWATRAGCATATFRNWDHPYRRQIFSGIRLARDA